MMYAVFDTSSFEKNQRREFPLEFAEAECPQLGPHVHIGDKGALRSHAAFCAAGKSHLGKQHAVQNGR